MESARKVTALGPQFGWKKITAIWIKSRNGQLLIIIKFKSQKKGAMIKENGALISGPESLEPEPQLVDGAQPEPEQRHDPSIEQDDD